ncbi:MAG: DoxX family protein, partial [Pseudomonadota bacterium]
MSRVTLVVKGIFSAVFLLIAAMKAIQNPQVIGSLINIGMPDYLGYILAFAYAAGVVGIWQSFSRELKIWAYAGYTFALLGAFASHLFGGDPITAAAPSIVLLIVALFLYY